VSANLKLIKARLLRSLNAGPFRQNWPSVVFALLLSLCVILLVIAPAFTGITWCDEGDRSKTVCLRNWISAAGSVLTLFVAGAAAAFAYRQFREAQRQASIGALPHLEQRLRTASDLAAIAKEARKVIEDVCVAIETARATKGQPSGPAVYNACLPVARAVHEMRRAWPAWASRLNTISALRRSRQWPVTPECRPTQKRSAAPDRRRP
jgi:hypothetical protein